MSQPKVTRLGKKNHSQQNFKGTPHAVSEKSSEYLVFLGFQIFLSIVSIKTNSALRLQIYIWQKIKIPLSK